MREGEKGKAGKMMNKPKLILIVGRNEKQKLVQCFPGAPVKVYQRLCFRESTDAVFGSITWIK